MNEQIEKVGEILQQHFANFPTRKMVKVLTDLPIENVAYLTIFAMEEAFGKIKPEVGKSWSTVHPSSPTFVNLGKSILRGIEDATDPNANVVRGRAGYECFNAMFEAGILQMVRGREQRAPYRLKVRKGHEEWVEEVVAIIDKIEPPIPIYTRPQFEEPTPFTSFYSKDGGQMVRNVHPDAIPFLNAKEAPKVYEVINKHMANKYVINTDVLNVYMNSQEDNVFTHQEKIDKDLLDQEQLTGLYRERDKVLEIANWVGDREFYEYAFYDSRGRLYSSAVYLSHAGCKLSKSLFNFATPAPLTSGGYFWLLVHAANCWGYDKDSIDGRYEFADANLDGWLEVAKNPIEDKRWQEADDPFNFLAAIMEIQKAMEFEGGPYEYPSGLPVAWDATCSGLQVLSALARDEKSGALCNLTATDERGDYYKMIAEHVWKSCTYTDQDELAYYGIQGKLAELDYGVRKATSRKMRMEASEERKAWKKENSKLITASAKVFWAKLVEEKPSISRKICKRPCMTYFYSAQAKTMANQMYGDFKSEVGFDGLDWSYCMWISDQIYKACQELMPVPTKLMKLFQDLGLKDYADGEHFTLRAPVTNFYLKQKYSEDATTRLKVGYLGQTIKLKITVEKNARVKRSKVLSATSPNVVHMLDSQIVAGMMLHCNYPVSTIHDSFSSRPCDAGKLYEDTRQVFVDIFESDILFDILQQKDALGLVQEINLGSLDIKEVYDNEHCFS